MCVGGRPCGSGGRQDGECQGSPRPGVDTTGFSSVLPMPQSPLSSCRGMRDRQPRPRQGDARAVSASRLDPVLHLRTASLSPDALPR
eukprot:355908-Chlamydomonas_euryale.AAC.10